MPAAPVAHGNSNAPEEGQASLAVSTEGRWQDGFDPGGMCAKAFRPAAAAPRLPRDVFGSGGLGGVSLESVIGSRKNSVQILGAGLPGSGTKALFALLCRMGMALLCTRTCTRTHTHKPPFTLLCRMGMAHRCLLYINDYLYSVCIVFWNSHAVILYINNNLYRVMLYIKMCANTGSLSTRT